MLYMSAHVFELSAFSTVCAFRLQKLLTSLKLPKYIS